ncbi:MAG: hypothetical protein R2789_17555 [Microthrixaceae bacterium]
MANTYRTAASRLHRGRKRSDKSLHRSAAARGLTEPAAAVTDASSEN